jgi:hypothetical protein
MRLFLGNMKARTGAFNIYLCGGVAALLCAGCATGPIHESREDKPDKQLTALRLHVEAIPDPLKRTVEVPVFRARPLLVTVDKNPFITENNVLNAEVVDDEAGFSLRIEFERQGRWLLEGYTAQHQNRRLAIFAQFGPNERWLAAPVIRQVISDGKLTFVPDATRDEALRIVRGLKNYARDMKHDPRF